MAYIHFIPTTYEIDWPDEWDAKARIVPATLTRFTTCMFVSVVGQVNGIVEVRFVLTLLNTFLFV